MAKLTATQVQSYSRTTDSNKKYSDGNGLYFCVRKSGGPCWMLRYTKNLIRRLKHPNIPKRVFTKEIAPVIGKFSIQAVKRFPYWW